MKFIGVICFVAFLSTMSVGQNSVLPCKTEPYKSEWLTNFQYNLDKGYILENGDDTLLYLPIKLHILGNDEGNGYFPLASALTALCVLNRDFEQANIHFYLDGDVNYINNTSWNNHDDIRIGAEMMFTNNFPEVINCYILSDPAGACGYNLPYAGIALRKGCVGPLDHTWSHEVGHNLSLPHPFLGWEGGRTHDNSQPPIFNEPAPDWITYDYTLFKSKFYPDTTIIDTAFVERTDASNCREAADGFCDTSPDYLASRWVCGNNGLSPQIQTDPNGEKFQSEGKWLMSYADDRCSSDFSDEQIMAMRANVREEKPFLLKNQNPPTLLNTVSTLIYPEDGGEIDVDGEKITWSKVPGATHYILEVSRIPSFGFIEINEILGDTSFLVDDLILNKKYYWRVKAYNNYEFCSLFSRVGNFTVRMLTSVISSDLFTDIEHNIVDGDLILRFNCQSSGIMKIYIWNASGIKVNQVITNVVEGRNLYKTRLNDNPQAMYFVRLDKDDRSYSFKIIR